MPREGTKTGGEVENVACELIEIRYAPGGDENNGLRVLGSSLTD